MGEIHWPGQETLICSAYPMGREWSYTDHFQHCFYTAQIQGPKENQVLTHPWFCLGFNPFRQISILHSFSRDEVIWIATSYMPMTEYDYEKAQYGCYITKSVAFESWKIMIQHGILGYCSTYPIFGPTHMICILFLTTCLPLTMHFWQVKCIEYQLVWPSFCQCV